VADAAVGDDRDGAADRLRRVVDGGDLRDADAAHDTRGADRAGADADFDGMGTGLLQGQGAFGGGDVAADHIDVGIVLRDPAHHVEDALAVAVGAVDHHHIDLFVREHRHAVVVAGADGGGHAQTVARIAGVERLGVLNQLQDIGKGVEADQPSVAVHEGQLADLVLHHDGIGLFQRGVGRGRDHARGHDLCDARRALLGEADVAGGHDACEAVLVVEDRKTAEREMVVVAVLLDVGQSVGAVEGDRLHDQAVEVVLDAAHMLGLNFGRQVLMDHADAAEHRHGGRHAGLGHGVHRGADKRDVQADTAGQPRGERGLIGKKVGVPGDQRDIVEGQAFERELFHESGNLSVYVHR